MKYKLLTKIDNNLLLNFSIKRLYHRIFFICCLLLTKKYYKLENDYSLLQKRIYTVLQNTEYDILLKIFSEIDISVEQKHLNELIDDITQLFTYITGDEDIIGNFYNIRKTKSEYGQIFTPNHIISLMYKLLGCNENDIILDACCGSGSFLIKSNSYGIEFDREIFALACINTLLYSKEICIKQLELIEQNYNHFRNNLFAR